jgi:hypothetical protein
MLGERPQMGQALERILMRAAERLHQQVAIRALRMYRGEVSQLDTILATLSQAPPSIRAYVAPLLYPAAVLDELQGLRKPSLATATSALRRVADPTRASPETVAEAHWIAAVNGLLRGDTTLVREQLALLQHDTTAESRIAARSVRALTLGFSGNTSAAAESLLTLERVHGDSLPKVWAAFAANRLLGSQWLTQHGRLATADSLIRFTQGFNAGDEAKASYLVHAAVQLQRSRIAEGMGDGPRAAREARIFLAAYDLPSSAARPWVDEARERARRFGGYPDTGRAREARVRP